MFVAALFQYTYLGVTFGVFQNLLHPRMRATGSALLNTVYGLIGQGLGPLLVGWMSDRLAPEYGGGDGLAYAMAITAAIYLWAGAHYLLGGPPFARRPRRGARRLATAIGATLALRGHVLVRAGIRIAIPGKNRQQAGPAAVLGYAERTAQLGHARAHAGYAEAVLRRLPDADTGVAIVNRTSLAAASM